MGKFASTIHWQIGLIWLAQLIATSASNRPVFAEEIPPGQIQNWIRELSAHQYVVRDAATQQLIGAGPAAVKPVAEAMRNNSLEVTTRGIFILQELALSGDMETEETARDALQRLAARQSNAASRRAAESLEKLDSLKQDRSLQELAHLGARIDTNYREIGLMTRGIFAVEFGEQWRGTEEDLHRLKWLRDVEQVTFLGEKVNDRWVRHVRGMERLMILKIGNANISDAAMAYVKDLQQLRFLKLLYVPVSDKAIDQLVACKQIAKVLAYGTQLSAEGAQRLAAGGIDIDHRRGAFLGISVPRNNEGENWFINQVTANSAAERAGLQPGDVIVRYADQPVTDFVSLMAMIAKNNAGDSVTLQVRRGSEMMEKTITFGSWE